MRLLGFTELKTVKGIGYSRSQIDRKVKEGSFPRPIVFSTHRKAWLESEVDAWIEDLALRRAPVSTSDADGRQIVSEAA